MSNVDPSALRRLLLYLLPFLARWWSLTPIQPKVRKGGLNMRQTKGAGGMLASRYAPYCPRPDWPYHVLARLGHRAPRSHQKRLGWA